MHLIVTCPSGFEVEAKKELEAILGRCSVNMTYFCGLLRVKMAPEDALTRLGDADTSYLSKVVPIRASVQADIPSIKRFFSDKMPAGTFAVRCKRRGSHGFSSKAVEIEVGAMLTEKGAKVDLSSPETILWIDIIQDRAHLAMLPAKNIIKKTPKVQRRWKKGERPISRAELKIREIIDVFPEIFTEDKTVLDIGAAPGGWTKAISGKVKKVMAVDRAKLDEAVLAIENVVYIKERAENLLIDEKVDILTNDANLLHMQSAEISIDLAEKYLKDGGTLIHTVKFGVVPKSGKLAAKSLNHAAEEVKVAFEKAKIKTETRKLEYNTRNEITIIGRK